MKKLAALLLLSAAVARAEKTPTAAGIEQDVMKKASDMYKSGGEEGPDPAMELEHYSRSLQLDEPQRAKVLDILNQKRRLYQESAKLRQSFQQQTLALHQKILKMNHAFHLELKRFDGKQAEALAKIRAALSEQQQSTFDAMESERARLEEEFRRMRVEQSQRDHNAREREEKR